VNKNTLDTVIYNKLLLQAEEANDQNLTKLANGILAALESKDDKIEYSCCELNNDIYFGLWKLAANFIKYYDLNSVDAQKLNEIIEINAEKFVNDLEKSLDMELKFGANEPKVPGQT